MKTIKRIARQSNKPPWSWFGFTNAALLLLLLGPGFNTARAATITWTGAASTAWNNSTNWNPQVVPTSTDTAVINAGTVLLTTPNFSR